MGSSDEQLLHSDSLQSSPWAAQITQSVTHWVIVK